jgi:hypothetical protein
VPAANKPWERRFPGIFNVRDGYVRTGEIGARLRILTNPDPDP